jgi:hypothetical protein
MIHSGFILKAGTVLSSSLPGDRYKPWLWNIIPPGIIAAGVSCKNPNSEIIYSNKLM